MDAAISELLPYTATVLTGATAALSMATDMLSRAARRRVEDRPVGLVGSELEADSRTPC